MTAKKISLAEVRKKNLIRLLIETLEEQQRDDEQRDHIARLEKDARQDYALRRKLEDRITDLERRLGDAEAAAS